MSRNYAASENPPKHWKPTRRHLRDLARTEGWYSLRNMPWPHLLALIEGLERFERLNPTRRNA